MGRLTPSPDFMLAWKAALCKHCRDRWLAVAIIAIWAAPAPDILGTGQKQSGDTETQTLLSKDLL